MLLTFPEHCWCYKKIDRYRKYDNTNKADQGLWKHSEQSTHACLQTADLCLPGECKHFNTPVHSEIIQLHHQ